MYIHIPKYNVFRLYNVICVYYFFKVDNLVLDNKLACSSLRKTISPSLRIPQLPVGFCVGLRFRGLSLI